jgi:hypothetical protein
MSDLIKVRFWLLGYVVVFLLEKPDRSIASCRTLDRQWNVVPCNCIIVNELWWLLLLLFFLFSLVWCVCRLMGCLERRTGLQSLGVCGE